MNSAESTFLSQRTKFDTTAQSAFTCLKLTIETLEKAVK